MRISTTSDKVQGAMEAIRAAGGAIGRRKDGGSISVKGVSANFSFSEETGELDIRITDTPWYASTSMVEDEIKKFFQ